MASVIKLSYHKRLFLVIIVFLWSVVFCFIGFQYLREQQYKSDFLSAQLQLYNRHLLEIVEEGQPYEEYIMTHNKPFDELRVTIITLSGAVVYDNILSIDSLDNRRERPEVVQAMKNGSGFISGDSLRVTDASISIQRRKASVSWCVLPSHIRRR